MRKLYEDRLIKIVRSVVTDSEPRIPDIEPSHEQKVIEGAYDELLAFAKWHQLEHLAEYAFYANGLTQYNDRFFSHISLTEQQIQAANEISAVLESKGIKHIPLKGTVMRAFYPERWMRNSCDIDILVREDELYSAKAIVESLGYEMRGEVTSHDITFYRGQVHTELHYRLVEDSRMRGPSEILGRVWEVARPCEGRAFTFEMPDEYFYFYHVAHMAKHFGDGGCGIRPILDLWLLNNRCESEREARLGLLSEGGLLRFEEQMVRLSEYWFSDGSGDGLALMEHYIFSGGAYGNVRLSREVRKSRNGRVRYLLSRIFMPYKPLSNKYPVLKRHSYLLPVFEVWRWIEALIKDRKKHTAEFKDTLKKSNDIIGMLAELELTEFS